MIIFADEFVMVAYSRTIMFETQCCMWFWWRFVYDFACLQDWVFILNCQIFVSGSKIALVSLQMELHQCKSPHIPIIWYPVPALLVSRLGFILKLVMGDFFCFMSISKLPGSVRLRYWGTVSARFVCYLSVSRGWLSHPLTSLSFL